MRRKKPEQIRDKILYHLRAHGPATAMVLEQIVGVHRPTISKYLGELDDLGLIEVDNPKIPKTWRAAL